jgi:DNA-binding MarR family transcriptional regulator
MEPHDPRERLLPLMFEMGRLLKREIAQDGACVVSFLHLETLRFIQEHEKPTMSDIAEYLKIAPPSATALVNGFFKEGIIERTADSIDRRVVRLTLSTKGKNLLRQTMRQREKAFARVTASLSTKDCDELSRILKIITQKSIPLTK